MYSRLRITKLISGGLLLIFLYNTIGYFFIFKLEQSLIKKEAIENMQTPSSSDELQIIAFRNTDLKNVDWVEQEEEMRYKGKLYDIARTLKTADSTIYYCQSDEREDSLYVQLDDHVTNHILQASPKQCPKKSASKPFELYFLNQNSFSFDQYSISTHSQTEFLNVYLPIYMELNAPPPRFS